MFPSANSVQQDKVQLCPSLHPLSWARLIIDTMEKGKTSMCNKVPKSCLKSRQQALGFPFAPGRAGRGGVDVSQLFPFPSTQGVLRIPGVRDGV